FLLNPLISCDRFATPVRKSLDHYFVSLKSIAYKNWKRTNDESATGLPPEWCQKHPTHENAGSRVCSAHHRKMALAMSAFGPKRTPLVALNMSAIGGKADIGKVYSTFGSCGQRSL